MSPDLDPVLSLDTSQKKTGLSILKGGSIYSASTDFGRDLDSELPQFVAEFLKHHGLQFSDIKALLVVIGPGGFTGIRVGVAYMRGLAVGLGVPIFGVTSLEAKIGQDDLPLWTSLPARLREPDKSWWVQRFDTPSSEAPVIEMNQDDMDTLPAIRTNATKEQTTPPHLSRGAIEWWQAGRNVREGASAHFVRSAFR